MSDSFFQIKLLTELSRAKIDVCNTTLMGLSKLELTEIEVLRDNELENSMDIRSNIFTF